MSAVITGKTLLCYQRMCFGSLNELIFARSQGQTVYLTGFCEILPSHCANHFAHMFNSSVAEGIVPSIWKQANVVAVPKIRPPKLIESDLRQISLNPTLSKVFESLVGRWVVDAIGEKFDKKQYRALKGALNNSCTC